MKQNDDIEAKTSRALKWSSLGEIFAKVLVPISNMILARVLAPEAFGVVATVTMIISFADTLSDSGFQKYLIQHDFKDWKKFKESIDVAFTCNLAISLLLWGLIAIFSDKLATLTGDEGLGSIFVVAGSSLAMTALSSIYTAVLRRNFDYKKLFYSRIVGVVTPLIITVPLALLGFSYWSLIIGNVVGNIAMTLILWRIAKISLRIKFRYATFKEMFSFSAWSLLESIGTWLSLYIGTFIVGIYLNQYYLGLYKTIMTAVNGIFAIVTSATTSVLFAALSRLQHDKDKYNDTYLEFIRSVGIIIIPLGFGIFAYQGLVTDILLGSQWKEGTFFVGIYGLLCSFSLVLGQYCSEYFRGFGRPNLNVLMTVLHLAALVPVLIISSNVGFESLAYARSFVKVQQILVYWLILYFAFHLNPLKILTVNWKAVASALIMLIPAVFINRIIDNFFILLISAILCVFIYFGVYWKIFKGKKELINAYKMFTGKAGNSKGDEK